MGKHYVKNHWISRAWVITIMDYNIVLVNKIFMGYSVSAHVFIKSSIESEI